MVIASILVGAHLVLLAMLGLARSSSLPSAKQNRRILMLALVTFTALYGVSAAGLAAVTGYTFAVELVALIRFVFHDARWISLGTGDSRSVLRHTEHVFSKSLTAGTFTALMLEGVLALCGLASLHGLIAAWVALVLVEYTWRRARSTRILAEEAARKR